MSQATLLVLRGPDQGFRYSIGETDSVSIGRGVRSDIRILDTEVSRSHAVLTRTGNAFGLRDCGSSNGTYLNGTEVKAAELHDGDQVQVGGTVLLFNRAGAVDAADSDVSVDFVESGPHDDRSEIVRELPHEATRAFVDRDDSSPSGLAHTVENLNALYRISEEVITPAVSLEQILRRTLDLCINTVGADRGCLLLSNPGTGRLEPQAFRHRSDVPESGRMPISRSIVNYVVERGQGVRTSDAQHDRRFDAGRSILRAGIREVLCVPLQGRYELLGVVYVDTTLEAHGDDDPSSFDDDHLRLLLAIARQCALAVENDRYQTAFVKAERLAAMGQTIATLSHHIKNILQGVRGGSYLIDRGLGQHDENLVRKGWGIVEKNQDRIYHLVMDMLTFSTERKPALEPASLNEVVLDIKELAGSRAEEYGVRLDVELDETLGDTVFDAEGLHRAILNIVGNAIDAVEGHDGGRVLVRTGHHPSTDEVFVEVSDNGPGIPEEQLASIFQVFESSKGARGTGLGLAVSRKILREHGGDIRVTSTVDVGSRFVLAWPRIEDESEPRAGRKTMSDIPIPADLHSSDSDVS